MEGNAAGVAGSFSKLGEMQASREQYWEEADANDKIARLRDEVARLCKVVTDLSALTIKLGAHKHASDGSLMVPLAADEKTNRIGLFAHDNGIPHRIRLEYERR